MPSKFDGWGAAEFETAGFRAVPNCIVRHSAYIAPGVVLMPSFVNLGAHVDEGTMVDTWATVGSCAQIGKNCHLSGGVGIGGVLEPLQAGPTIIEDNCFIGARSEVVEGVVVGEGSVLSMGVFIGASTKIVDRATGEVHMGRVPPYSVVVSGTLPGKPLPYGEPGPSLYCAVIVKRVDEKTRAKTSINERKSGSRAPSGPAGCHVTQIRIQKMAETSGGGRSAWGHPFVASVATNCTHFGSSVGRGGRGLGDRDAFHRSGSRQAVRARFPPLAASAPASR